MNLSIFHPNFRSVSNPADSFFDSFWNGAWTAPTDTMLAPRVDVFDEGEKLIVEAELPGVRKGDVSVNLERGVLTIKAEKKSTRDTKNKDLYVAERTFGAYERSFRVSEEIDTDSIKATFEDGVLRVEMSRKPEAAGRKIEVK
ncbi:MAG TPA: Hsp20/alpha crystallin family protein [Fibrobacteraceae bacterium]|nr:Hsp20/alpha crystallin family protein [Fibrobacteraceae bacterium]